MAKQKLAVIGANYLQKPLVEKAVDLGIETHVFAWEKGNIAASVADYYYPVSVIEKETILEKCREIGIDGITSVGSDVAMPTVNYVADKLGLVGNSLESTVCSTNKFEMRKKFEEAGIKCPKFTTTDVPDYQTDFDNFKPLMVKPVDREGSIGVTKVEREEELTKAILEALDKSFQDKVIIEEFICGNEYSVEMISFKGRHYFLTVTEKVTTGPPYFVEIAHHQPAQISNEVQNKIIDQVIKGVDALGLKNGATHSEVILTDEEEVFLVEIAGRTGGCFIGSHMVYHSTGYDYLKGVIDIALGQFDEKSGFKKTKEKHSGVYYIIPPPGRITKVENCSGKYESIVKSEILLNTDDIVTGVVQGPANRGALFVYEGDQKLEFQPEEVIKFTVG